MKYLFLALLAFGAPQARAATLEIVNDSSLRADIGEWKGIKVPSICEDFKPCWVEVNQKFHPAPGLGNIRGVKPVEIAPRSVIKLYVGGGERGTYDITESCRDIPADDLGYYYQLDADAHLSQIKALSICLVNAKGRLIID